MITDQWSLTCNLILGAKSKKDNQSEPGLFDNGQTSTHMHPHRKYRNYVVIWVSLQFGALFGFVEPSCLQNVCAIKIYSISKQFQNVNIWHTDTHKNAPEMRKSIMHNHKWLHGRFVGVLFCVVTHTSGVFSAAPPVNHFHSSDGMWGISSLWPCARVFVYTQSTKTTL